MNRRLFVAAALSTPFVAGCSAPLGFSPPAGGVNGMLSGMQKYMGTSADQTAASAGALFGLAQNKLSPADFAKLNTSLPGLSDLVTKGTGILGVSPSSLTSMSSVTSALSKLNVNPAQLSQMSGYIGNYLGGSGANNAASMLAGVLR
jgi:hypothetical protein